MLKNIKNIYKKEIFEADTHTYVCICMHIRTYSVEYLCI